jgi:hypothetical protein
MLSRLSYSNVMATVAVFIALGGTSYAAIKVTGKNVKDASLTGKDVRNSSITSTDIKNGSLLAKDVKAGELAGGTGGQNGQPGRDATAPQGAVMFFDRSDCPDGWSQFTEARGRYLVGLPQGGTLKGTSGTPLADQEDRPVGQHNHSGTFNHTHPTTVVTPGTTPGVFGVVFGFGGSGFVQSGGTSGGVLQIANAGAVAGTNAPYVQLRACRKD